MKKKIKLSDLELMLHLFAPKKCSLFFFDPLGRIDYDKDPSEDIFDANGPKVLINLADKVTSYKGVPLSDFNMIFDFGISDMPSIFKSVYFNILQNNTGGMRWLYEKGKLKYALSFYNTSS